MTNKICLCNATDHYKCLNNKIYKLTAIDISTLYLLGVHIKQISLYAGVSYQSIFKVLRQHRIHIFKPSELDQTHREICNNYLNNMTIKQLTIKYNKSYSGIYSILKRHNIILRGREITI